MDFLKELVQEQDGALIKELGAKFNLDSGQTVSALSNLLPQIASNLNAGDSNLFGSLLSAFTEDNLKSVVDNPSEINSENITETGNSVLGHIFGSKEVSRQVAAKAADGSEFSTDLMKQMLPVVTTMVMGMLSKKAVDNAGGLSSLGAEGGLSGMLTGMLDSDKDGSVADDLMNMAKKLF